MLVLTRKQNEKIRIGENITITVLRMKGKAVRLGIEAPHDLNVIRGELAFEVSDGEVLEEASRPRAKSGPRDSRPRNGQPACDPTHPEVSSEATCHWPIPTRQDTTCLAPATPSQKTSSF